MHLDRLLFLKLCYNYRMKKILQLRVHIILSVVAENMFRTPKIDDGTDSK